MDEESGLAATRTIRPLPLAESLLAATVDPGPLPVIEYVDPRTLFVEDGYQRQLSERSVALIHRIVREFDWRAFKPPIVARSADGVMMVIDGQHTAIGAASHPHVPLIPVVVVEAGAMIDRAQAFLHHNRDRVGMTAMQIHHAALAAGDEIAMAVNDACRRAGARILRNPQAGVTRIGDTMAVTTIATICRQRGVVFTARLLKILVEAGQAPIDALSVRAVFELLTDEAWKGTLSAEALSVTIRSQPLPMWIEWAEINVRKGMKMPRSRALAQAWWQKTRKTRAS